jgi:hypothetical protein
LRRGFERYVDFEKWSNIIYRPLHPLLQYPNSAFCVHVFPFGKVTVLTSRKLINEMNHAPPDDLSFDEVSQAVRRVKYWFNPILPVDAMRKQLIQPEHTTFGRAPSHYPIAVLQQNFNRRLDSLFPDMFDASKTAVNSALEYTTGGGADTGLLSHQS